jgi:hypothetical protein
LEVFVKPFEGELSGRQEDMERLENLADWLDTRFAIPGTKIRFGLDGLLGLIPGFGDTVTAVSTAYLIGMGVQLGLPAHLLLLIAWNGFLDWFIGLIPIIGDLFDIGFKANRRNVDLIRSYLYKHEEDGVIEGEVVEKEVL